MVSAVAAQPAHRPLDETRSGAARGGAWLFRLSVAAVIFTYLLIVAGATVRVTGSGLGCPDWPTCHGRLIPPLETGAIIEYTHRLIGAITSPLILAVPVAAWLFRAERRVLLPALALPVLLVTQILLGSLVVYLELPPMAVLVHLGFALLILGALVWVAARTAPPTSVVATPQRPPSVILSAAKDPLPLRTLIAGTAAAVFLLILTGAFTRATGASVACTGFPGCDVPEAALSALEGSAGLSGATLVGIHLVHRTMAYLTSALVLASVVVVWRSRRGVLRSAAAALGASVVVQVAIGATAVSTGLPAFLRGAHVAGAALVWACAVLLLALELRRHEASRPIAGMAAERAS